MQLNMFANAFQVLPHNDNVVRTGPMGDCVSVIVLYNLVGIVYQNVRGRHGLGGIENADLPAMLNGVPNAPASQVIVVPGSLQQSPFALTHIMQYLDNEVKTVAGLNTVTTRVVAGMSNANIDRQARVTHA